MRGKPALVVWLAVLGLSLAAGVIADSGDVESQVETLQVEAPAINPDVLRLALTARRNAAQQGLLTRPEILTVIDYSLPSTQPRLWVFDLDDSTLLYKELVAHGKGTGENFARYFSNRHGSKQSSLGLFSTADTYYGRNGYSLHLNGLEEGVNDQALDRTIVMHGAWYVSREFAREHGRLGRSWGCPALRQDVSSDIIDQIKDGSALFVYYPDKRWLTSSDFLTPTTPDRFQLNPTSRTRRNTK